MPNPKGNPEFKLKYGEKTKVARLPESVADAVTALLKTSSDSVTLIKNLPFIPAIERANFPKIAVIYFVYTDTRLLYIGRANNLRQRFTEHHRSNQFDELNANVAWFSVEDPKHLPRIENSLIDLLDPELNWTEVFDRKVISFRVSVAEIEALEKLRIPEDSGLACIAKRVLYAHLNVAPKGNTDEEVYERIAEIEDRINAIAPDRELIREEVDQRTAYLAVAVNEIKAQLENEIEFLKTRVNFLEQNQEEKLINPPIAAKATPQDMAFPLIQEQEEVEVDEIAPEATEENMVSVRVGTRLSREGLESKANSIQNYFRGKNIKMSKTVIKTKILELYPNSEDWLSTDAKWDVIRILKKEHQKHSSV